MLTDLLAFVLSLPLQIGQPAPPITAAAWLNGETRDLTGQPVLVEFWGTWCAPCVAAMPHVQDLWARYRDQGLRVAAISYEAPEVMRSFLEQHGYTMPVGSDPEKTCIEAFGVTSWPTTFVIDREGSIVYRGFPSGAEPFVQQVLGLETSAATLLSRYVDGEGDPQATLELLVRNAPRDFELGVWAEGRGGSKGKPPRDPGEALSNLATLRGSPLAAAPLSDLASIEEPFDLRAWAQRELGTLHPIGDEAFAALVEGASYADVLEAVVTRSPSDKALAKAKSDDGWRDWCNERLPKYLENARVVVLLGHWTFGEYEEPEEIHFPPATAVSLRESPKGNEFWGVVLNTGEELTKNGFPACMHEYVARAAVVQSFSKRKVPDVEKAGAKLHDELFDELKGTYGKRKKKQPKAD